MTSPNFKIKRTTETWSLWDSKWNPTWPLPTCGGGHPSLPVLPHYSHLCLQHHATFLLSVSLSLCPDFPFLTQTPVILDKNSPLYSSMSSDELITSLDVPRYWGLGFEHTILEDHFIYNRDRETKEKSFWDIGGRQKGAVGTSIFILEKKFELLLFRILYLHPNFRNQTICL